MKEKKNTERKMKKETDKIVETGKTSKKKSISLRGRTFAGKVIKKFPKRVVIEFERNSYVRKYERYLKFRTRIHARLPENMESSIQIGDYIKIQECRPLSKLIHFVVIGKVKEE